LAKRAEDAGNSGLRESFDVVIVRAVATLPWLAEWCLPLAKVKTGKVLAMKGARAGDELAAAIETIKRLGGGAAVIHPIDLPGTEHHVIIEIPKVARTDRRYPRPATIAKGRPIF